MRFEVAALDFIGDKFLRRSPSAAPDFQRNAVLSEALVKAHIHDIWRDVEPFAWFNSQFGSTDWCRTLSADGPGNLRPQLAVAQ